MRRPSGGASSLLSARTSELNRLQRRQTGARTADTVRDAGNERRRTVKARCEKVARHTRGLNESVAGVVKGDASRQGPPIAAVGVRLGDVRKAVVECVACPDAPVPALGHRLRIPRAVAPWKVDRRADGFAVEPDAPPGFPVRHLEHLEAVFLARLDTGVELDVAGI